MIDDGSQDDTLDVAQEYARKDSRVRVFTQANAGVSSARNHGMREANGEYYVFLDSDDWFEDNALEILLGLQERYPDRLVAANFLQTKTFAEHKEHAKGEILILNSTEEALSSWWAARLQYIHSKLFRSAVIHENNLEFNEDIHYGEDAVFVFEYLNETCGVIYLDVPLTNILERSGSATRTPYEKRKLFQDYPQVMIDHPTNTERVREKLKRYHTDMFKNELNFALHSRADAETIRYLQTKTRMYLNEYMSGQTVRTRVKLWCNVYLPVPLAKCFCRSLNFARRVRDRIRRKR